MGTVGGSPDKRSWLEGIVGRGEIMPANERRFWICEHGHVMGEIKSIVVNSRTVRALMLYERSVYLNDLPVDMPTLRGKVIGSVYAIRCTICGRTRDWIIGEDGMQALLSRVSPRDV